MKKPKNVLGKTIGEHLVEGFEELRDIVRQAPVVAFCPFCGSDDVACVSNGKKVKMGNGVPRCNKCRCTFFAEFSRWLRKSPK